MANADSATNMLWLINQATAGEITASGKRPPAPDKSGGAEEEKKGVLSAADAADTSFNDIKIDMNA
jgi:hypothetical protein